MPVSTNDPDAKRYRDDDEHWLHVLEGIFVPAVVKAGFEPIRPTTEGSDLIHGRIVKYLQEADMVLCDLSGHNPNVFFEMGVRTATNLPIALVRDEHTSLPFDTSGINTHSYKSTLNTWEAAGEIGSLASYLASSEQACDGTNPLWRTFGLTLTATNPLPGESQQDARWELVTRELSEIRSAIGSGRQTQAAGSRRGAMRFEPLAKDSPTSTTLQAFARDALNISTEADRPLKWYWSPSDETSVFVPTEDYDNVHIATRRAVEEAARQRGLRIVSMPS